jgi:hypothetical protein
MEANPGRCRRPGLFLDSSAIQNSKWQIANNKLEWGCSNGRAKDLARPSPDWLFALLTVWPIHNRDRLF